MRYDRGDAFDLRLLGECDWAPVSHGVPRGLRQRMLDLNQLRQSATPHSEPVPTEVRELVERREEARGRHDWATADALRAELAERGYLLQDTPSGTDLHPRG